MAWVKTNKAQARKRYNQGESVFLIPCNMRIDNAFVAPFEITTNGKDIANIPGLDFDNIVKTFEYYNCTCNETGRRSAYYFKVLS